MRSNTMGNRLSETGTLAHKESHLGYSWGNFETEEDLAEAELYQCTSVAREADDFLSPFRDPESPLDEWDLEHFKVKTARLASYTDSRSCLDSDHVPESSPRTPTIMPMESLIDYEGSSDSYSSLPPPTMTLVDQQDLLAAIDRLERRVAFLETSIEQNHNSLEQQVLEKCEKLSDGIDRIIQLAVSGLQKEDDEHLTQTDNPTEGADSNCKPPISLHTAVTAPHDQTTSPQSPMTVLPPAEQYIQSWHQGSIILVEHLSEQTPVQDIHALFQPYGRITYLELHGANKSTPHIPTRHAYIHYAERSHALEARRNLHGFRFRNRNLMVFAISTAIVRGTPGDLYTGSALEILNFNGGSNYASPDADCFQVENEGLIQLDGVPVLPEHNTQAQEEVEPERPFSFFSDSSIKAHDTKAEVTYSLKPAITEKTAAASWRRMDAGADAATQSQGVKFAQSADGDGEIVFQGRAVRNHPTILHNIFEDREEEEGEKEDGGVPLDLERGDYLPYDYEAENEDAGLEFRTPVQPREFL
ncbi:MAG: hypothetical protein Q9216_000859 [Gyalolechia sp. 2 TL-2023]